MKQIISPKIKKARARKEKFERFKIKLYSYKVIKYITKQYKKTIKEIVTKLYLSIKSILLNISVS